MSLILEYLHHNGINQVEIYAAGGGDSGGVEDVSFISDGQSNLAPDMKKVLEEYLSEWTDHYLYDRYGAWYNDAGGKGTLTLWWNEDGGEGELDFIEYYDDSNNINLSNENCQTLITKFNCYLNKHPELAKWLKDKKISNLEISSDYYDGGWESPSDLVISAYRGNDTVEKPCEEISELLKEFVVEELSPWIIEEVENNAYRYTDTIDGINSNFVFNLNKSGFVETVETDLFYCYQNEQDNGANLDEAELLEIDNKLPPDLRARMEKEMLEASLPKKDVTSAKRKKAVSLGL